MEEKADSRTRENMAIVVRLNLRAINGAGPLFL